MQKTKITKKNVAKRIVQFTVGQLTSGRAHIIDKGWREIDVDKEFYDDSIHKIADLLGGKPSIREKIIHNLITRPYNHWSNNRIMYDPKDDRWSYCAGQDYTAEITEIRKYLSK